MSILPTEASISERELCDRWQVPIATWRTWRNRNQAPIKHFRSADGRIRYRVEAVLRFERQLPAVCVGSVIPGPVSVIANA